MSRGSGPGGGGFLARGQGLRPVSREERCTGAELHYEFVPRLTAARAAARRIFLELVACRHR